MLIYELSVNLLHFFKSLTSRYSVSLGHSELQIFICLLLFSAMLCSEMKTLTIIVNKKMLTRSIVLK